MPIISGTALWSRLGNDTESKWQSDDQRWSIHVIVSESDADEWVLDGKAQKTKWSVLDGVEVPCVVLRRDCKWKSGDDKEPVVVVDNYGQKIDPNDVGNGSTINVQYREHKWERNGDKGIWTELVAVQVTDLVRFDNRSSDEFSFMPSNGINKSIEEMLGDE